MINLPVLGLVAALGEPLLHLFLGRSFFGAWTAFAILVFGGGAMSLDIPITQVLLVKKVTKVLAVQQLVSSFTLASLAVLLIPRLYLDGAALAYVLARIAGFVVVGFSVYRLGLFSVKWRDYLETLSVTGVIIFATLVLEHFTGFSPLLLPFYLGVGAVVGLGMARTVGLLRAEDYEEVVEFFPLQLRGFVAWVWRVFGFPMHGAES
jgi:O-antigen/teichoic acid export membrane protein